ncbi:hypothetical protein JCM17846_29260 [Iodidimonas nitroreducens]|uniref:Uncharacterized protein n=1 Tax=Iodidimonas nitroreducens TaxID=1236968 RepID=A0A5A7NC05_9PROT|nr:hypothetical protein JCM17846_29260 [Iodidimonas nitroreducens]
MTGQKLGQHQLAIFCILGIIGVDQQLFTVFLVNGDHPPALVAAMIHPQNLTGRALQNLDHGGMIAHLVMAG